MTIERYAVSQIVPIQTELQVKKLEDGLYLYKRTTASGSSKVKPGATMKAPKAISSRSVDQGAVDEEGRAALLEGKNPSKLPFMALGHEHLEGFRLKGWPAMESMLYGMKEKGKEKQPSPTDLWDLFEANPALTADNLVRLDGGSHMVFDRHDKPLPVAVFFDYISSRIDESDYDLPKLAEHLMQRMDVLVYKETRGRSEGYQEADTVKEAIFTIPHYNAEEGRTQSVQFIWSPSAEDYAKVWACCKGKYPSTQVREKALELDLLDIKQFKHAKSLRPSW